MDIKRIILCTFLNHFFHLLRSHAAAVHSVDHSSIEKVTGEIKGTVTVKSSQKNHCHRCNDAKDHQFLFPAFSAGTFILIIVLIVFVVVFIAVVIAVFVLFFFVLFLFGIGMRRF